MTIGHYKPAVRDVPKAVPLFELFPKAARSAFVGVVAFRSSPEAPLQVLSLATPACLQRR